MSADAETRDAACERHLGTMNFASSGDREVARVMFRAGWDARATLERMAAGYAENLIQIHTQEVARLEQERAAKLGHLDGRLKRKGIENPREVP